VVVEKNVRKTERFFDNHYKTGIGENDGRQPGIGEQFDGAKMKFAGLPVSQLSLFKKEVYPFLRLTGQRAQPL